MDGSLSRWSGLTQRALPEPLAATTRAISTSRRSSSKITRQPLPSRAVTRQALPEPGLAAAFDQLTDADGQPAPQPRNRQLRYSGATEAHARLEEAYCYRRIWSSR